MRYYSKGFTIVELIIVVVIIAVLAAISIVAYNGVQQRAEYSRARTDLKHINDAIQVYKAQNGSYPAGTGAYVVASTALASLVPSYLDKSSVLTAKTGYRYRYRADTSGTNYKLLRTINSGTLPSVERSGNELLTTSGTYANNAWGYWTAGAASW